MRKKSVSTSVCRGGGGFPTKVSSIEKKLRQEIFPTCNLGGSRPLFLNRLGRLSPLSSECMCSIRM